MLDVTYQVAGPEPSIPAGFLFGLLFVAAALLAFAVWAVIVLFQAMASGAFGLRAFIALAGLAGFGAIYAWFQFYGPEARHERHKERLRAFASTPLGQDLPREFNGNSLYLPETDANHPFRPCGTGIPVWMAEDCTLPARSLLATGYLDFIETGRAPVLRWRVRVHDPACETPFLWNERDMGYDLELVGVQAICVRPEPVERPAATHLLTAEAFDLPEDLGGNRFYRLTLSEAGSEAPVDIFDLIPNYFDTHAPTGRAGAFDRRWQGPIWRLTNYRQYDIGDFARGRLGPPDEGGMTPLGGRVLADFGVDEARLLAALPADGAEMGREVESFACRADVRAQLSGTALAALEAHHRRHRGDDETWQEHCAAWYP